MPRSGGAASTLDKHGTSQPAVDQAGAWSVRLPGASAHFADDPNGYYFIGGDPVVLIEDGVAASAPIAAPTLGCG
jgi:hypothetical protein